MTRDEFLEGLRLALQGNVSQKKVNDNLQYYERYIIEESRKGKTEEAVIEELGDPRLIARSIIDAGKYLGNTYDETYYEAKKEPKRKRGFHIDESEDGRLRIRYGKFQFNSWYGILLAILIFILLTVIVGKLIVFLLPIIFVIVLVGMIIAFISKR